MLRQHPSWDPTERVPPLDVLNMKALRVLLAEDQAILRQSLKTLIANEPDIEVVDEAADGDQASLPGY